MRRRALGIVDSRLLGHAKARIDVRHLLVAVQDSDAVNTDFQFLVHVTLPLNRRTRYDLPY